MDPNNTANNGKEYRRQQFTCKQRMDMYAFCVLEMEINSNKVSIKKQQQAIQRVLSGQQQQRNNNTNSVNNNNDRTIVTTNQTRLRVTNDISNSTNYTNVDAGCQQQRLESPANPSSGSPDTLLPVTQTTDHQQSSSTQNQADCDPAKAQLPPRTSTIQTNTDKRHNNNGSQSSSPPNESYPINNNTNNINKSSRSETSKEFGEKTLIELKQEVARIQTCYSDYQRTQVLTSSMLREVQKRFAKYYPEAAIPSRTTIKHVFDKCVEYGTVENKKKPRKVLKIPQGDEIEQMLAKEPQLSLRQLAQKLNVSTGTISRRCKALGLVPESVTLKHQQLASARRQRRIRRLESLSSSTNTTTMDDDNNANASTSNTMDHDQHHSSSCTCLDCADRYKIEQE